MFTYTNCNEMIGTIRTELEKQKKALAGLKQLSATSTSIQKRKAIQKQIKTKMAVIQPLQFLVDHFEQSSYPFDPSANRSVIDERHRRQ